MLLPPTGPTLRTLAPALAAVHCLDWKLDCALGGNLATAFEKSDWPFDHRAGSCILPCAFMAGGGGGMGIDALIIMDGDIQLGGTTAKDVSQLRVPPLAAFGAIAPAKALIFAVTLPISPVFSSYAGAGNIDVGIFGEGTAGGIFDRFSDRAPKEGIGIKSIAGGCCCDCGKTAAEAPAEVEMDFL